MEPELRQPEVVADDEPRYLRRQRPVEIRRRKFGRRAWLLYARVTGGLFGLLGAGLLAYETAHFLLHSPRFLLMDPDQIELVGNRFVPRSAVLEKFSADHGQSLLRVPLAQRRAALEEIPWVERAIVERLLPAGLRVELVERTPVAFLRMNTEVALLDASGVILERPLEGNFHFPVVAGFTELTPRAERAKRMRLFVQFLEAIEKARPGATDQVSEVGLAEGDDLRATLVNLPEAGGGPPGGHASLLVRFGDSGFGQKFQIVMDHLAQWRAAVGRVDSVDLRFNRQVVVNPESESGPVKPGSGSVSAHTLGEGAKAR